MGHAITAAPLVVDGKIIVGISGGEAGVRGFLDAYDAGRPRSLVVTANRNGFLYALDRKTGKPLWEFQTGGAIRSGPMSYFAHDKQYIAIAGGHALFLFALSG